MATFKVVHGGRQRMERGRVPKSTVLVGKSRPERSVKIIEGALREFRLKYADVKGDLDTFGISKSTFARLAKADPVKFRRTVRDLFGHQVVQSGVVAGRVTKAQVVDSVSEALDEKVGQGDLSSADARAAVRAFLRRLPDDDDPTEAIGPYFDTAGLTARLKVKRQALGGRVDRNTLLAVQADDGSLLYPTFQFTPELEVLPGLAGVLKELDRVAKDGFSKAVWLTTPQELLEGMSAAEWLGDGRDPDAVWQRAHADVERMVA